MSEDNEGGKQFKPPYVAFADIEIGDNISDQSKTRMDNVSDAFCLSLDRRGLIEPLVVREGGPARTTGRRKVVLDCGYRRYGAIRRLRAGDVPGQKTKPASWNQIPVRYVKGDAEDQDVRNLVENLQRLDLDPFEEAAAIRAFMDKHGVSQAAVAAEIGKSEAYVSQRLSTLRNAAEETRRAYDDGVLNATQVREISDLPKDKQPALVESLRRQAASGKYSTVEDVRDDVAKVPAPRKKTGRKGQSFDQEKIAVAKEAYSDKKLAPRPRPAIMETLGMLVTRDQRNSTDKTKYHIQAIEYVLGIRDAL
jgi:ParB family transcriptional regulator, chromosome partitioning protein